ncbi:hypothetical protein J6590_032871 [Homalodisca vitripennis]|nr:hypothetical protein J6590_032871 [Homalodisca vitripennis]
MDIAQLLLLFHNRGSEVRNCSCIDCVVATCLGNQRNVTFVGHRTITLAFLKKGSEVEFLACDLARRVGQRVECDAWIQHAAPAEGPVAMRLNVSGHYHRLSCKLSNMHATVASFNDGNITKCEVLKCLGIEPGKDCVSAMKELDLIRIQKSDREAAELQKKARQSKRLLKRKLEEQLEEEDCTAGPSYARGMY